MRVLQCVLAVACVVAAQSDAAADERSDQQLIESLSAAVDQWLHDVEFACSYRRTFCRAAAVEDALAGRFGVEIEERRVTGVFNKAGALMRCSGDISHAPEITSESPEGSGTVAFLDYDDVSSADVLLEYQPVIDPRAPRGSATFLPRNGPPGSPGSNVGPFTAGMSSGHQPNAITLTGTPLRSYLRAPEGATSVSRTVAHVDDQRVAVVVKYEHQGVPTEWRVEFWLGGSVPVVDKLSKDAEHPTQSYKGRSQAFDFVECPGGPVPRIVRCASNNPSAKHPDLPWAVFEWKSEDLGNRPPTAEDFLVPIGKDTDIRGLANAKAGLRDGKLDITMVSALAGGGRAGAPTLPGEAPPRAEPVSRAKPLSPWLVWGSLAAVAIVVALLAWRAARRGASSGERDTRS